MSLLFRRESGSPRTRARWDGRESGRGGGVAEPQTPDVPFSFADQPRAGSTRWTRRPERRAMRGPGALRSPLTGVTGPRGFHRVEPASASAHEWNPRAAVLSRPPLHARGTLLVGSCGPQTCRRGRDRGARSAQPEAPERSLAPAAQAHGGRPDPSPPRASTAAEATTKTRRFGLRRRQPTPASPPPPPALRAPPATPGLPRSLLGPRPRARGCGGGR